MTGGLLYEALKLSHIVFVCASGALFALRGGYVLVAGRRMPQRWTRVAPHAVDTAMIAQVETPVAEGI